MILRALAVIISTLVVSSISMAQLDPSSAILLNSGRANTRDSALDSGRYIIRSRPEGNTHKDDPRPPATSIKKSQEPKDDTPPTPVTVTLPSQEAPPVQQQQPAIQQQPAQPIFIQQLPAAAPVPTPVPRARKSMAELRKQNLVELDFAPGFLYTNSDSSYYFRKFTSASPSIDIDAKVWVNPAFALHVGYLTSLSALVQDSLDGSKNVAITQSWTTAGLRLRKYFDDDFGTDGLNLNLGLDYYEYAFGVPNDAVLREKTKSTGVRLLLEAEVPTSTHHSWTLGFMFAPKLDHREIKGDADFTSGKNADANAIGAWIGGRIQFQQRDAIFWKISQTIEKDVFSGDASTSDPVKNITPSSVGITNSSTLLQIGYSWGN